MKVILTLIFFVKFIYSYLTNNYKYKSLNFDNSNNNSYWLSNEYKTNEGKLFNSENTPICLKLMRSNYIMCSIIWVI